MRPTARKFSIPLFLPAFLGSEGTHLTSLLVMGKSDDMVYMTTEEVLGVAAVHIHRTQGFTTPGLLIASLLWRVTARINERKFRVASSDFKYPSTHKAESLWENKTYLCTLQVCWQSWTQLWALWAWCRIWTLWSDIQDRVWNGWGSTARRDTEQQTSCLSSPNRSSGCLPDFVGH